MRILILVLSILMTAVAYAEDRVGEIYAKGKVEGEPLFTQSIHVDRQDGGKIVATSFIKDNKTGEIVLRENATLMGSQIISQTIEQLQIGELYELEVKDGQVHFRTYKIKDGIKTLAEAETSEKVGDNFITGPAAEGFLGKTLPELNDGKTVNALFGVMEVGKGIEFKFRKLASDDDKISIRMKPASFFVSMLVSPIEMQFSQKEKRLIHYTGRTPVRTLVNGKWKNLDADIIYKTLPAVQPVPTKGR